MLKFQLHEFFKTTDEFMNQFDEMVANRGKCRSVYLKNLNPLRDSLVELLHRFGVFTRNWLPHDDKNREHIKCCGEVKDDFFNSCGQILISFYRAAGAPFRHWRIWGTLWRSSRKRQWSHSDTGGMWNVLIKPQHRLKNRYFLFSSSKKLWKPIRKLSRITSRWESL